MKTKEEVIKEAWGEYYYDLKEFISDNGWISFFNDEKRIRDIFHDKNNIEVSPNHNNNWRPKSLQGIENNNGWTVIDENTVFPNGGCLLECISKLNGCHCVHHFEIGDEEYIREIFTHFKIIQFKKPLY